MRLLPACPPLVPYTTLFRSFGGRDRGRRCGGFRPGRRGRGACLAGTLDRGRLAPPRALGAIAALAALAARAATATTAATALLLRSEEHTSELQSRENLVCRL